MSVAHLSYLFQPRAIVVVGASNKPRTPGQIAVRNLLEGRFGGPVMPVCRHRSVSGVLAHADVASLPVNPDLALICDPGPDAPGLIRDLGQRGCRAAIVIAGNAISPRMMAAAAPFGMRLLGSHSLGVAVPGLGLNASLSHTAVPPGRIAFVSQSAAMFSTILDWSIPRGIGFSHCISLGSGEDIDFGDILDYLANDEAARAILLYVEDIKQRRSFVPAARAAARNKPLLLIKAGRSRHPGPAGPFLSSSLVEPGEVFDAVMRRAGALRVDHVDELFAAVETLAHNRNVKGERLGILCNGADVALMAADEMMLTGAGEPAAVTDLGAAGAAGDYRDTAIQMIQSRRMDALLAVHSPNALVDGSEAARGLIDAHKRAGGAVLACWLGGGNSTRARKLFAEAGLPSYETIGDAVRGFRHLVDFHRNQDMLLETPPSSPTSSAPLRRKAMKFIEPALAREDGIVSDPDTRELLTLYGIPTLECVLASTPEEAANVASRLGFPVAVTFSSADVVRKWDVGGVALNLETPGAVQGAAQAIHDRVSAIAPKARFDGFGIQRMALRPHARQLMIGIACDALFGPVIVFGEGGRAVEVVRDHALALPPLNHPLARNLIAATRIAKRLEAQPGRPPANLNALADALVGLSRLLADHPEIVACDINPLFADAAGVLAVDARIRVSPANQTDQRRFAILPYPAELEEHARLRDGSDIVLRPIRPEDEPAHAELAGRTDAADLCYRFFGAVQQFGHHRLARLTQIDYDREMAFIASRPISSDRSETLGVVRTVTDPDNEVAELAILVRSDLKGAGLGTALMDKIVRYHRDRKTARIVAQVLSGNAGMLALARKCGFSISRGEDPEAQECVLVLGGSS